MLIGKIFITETVNHTMILKILLGAIIGTSLMTIFSYIVAEVSEKEFKEPVLLNHLITQSSKLGIAANSMKFLGWILHYGMGLCFLVIYYLLWKYTFLEPTFLYGAMLGFISGLVGITIWKWIFSTHSNPPQINMKEYLLHLLIAHIVFGIGAVAGYTFL